MAEQEKMIPQTIYGKVQPQATDIEGAVLSACMGSKDGILTASNLLTREDFYLEQHQQVFESMQKLFEDSKPIDTMTVYQQVKAMDFEIPVSRIAELSNRISGTAHLEAHCRIVKEKSIKRQIIRRSTEMVQKGFDDTVDPLELLNEADLSITQIKNSIQKGRKRTKKDIVDQVMSRLIKGDKAGILLSGIPDVDNLMGRCEPGDVVVIAGRPGMGKSVFDCTIGKNVSIRQKIPSLGWGLEMTAEQSMRRMIANVGGLDYEKFKRGEIDPIEYEQAVSEIMNAPIHFEDYPSVTALDIRSRAIQMQRKQGLQVLRIDHGGIITKDGQGNESSQIGRIFKVLKAMAKELQIVVVVFWQLSRNVEMRGGDKTPRLSDLRSSGEIEEWADKIGFLWRPEYYDFPDITWRGLQYPSKGLAVFDLAKNRDGRTGKTLISFNYRNMRFESFEHEPQGKIDVPDHEYNPVESNQELMF